MSYRDRVSIKDRIDWLNENYYMLAVLATEEDDYPDDGLLNKVVTRKDMNDNSDIIFYLRSISTDSDLFVVNGVDQDLFIGYERYSFGNLKYSLLDQNYHFSSINKKVEAIRENLKNKILLIKPRVLYDERGDKYIKQFYIEDFDEFTGLADIKTYSQLQNEELIPIPGPEGATEEFEQQLLDGEEIIFPDFNIMEMESLDKIIVGDFIYYDPDNNWEITAYNKCKNMFPENIRKLSITDDFYNNVLYKYKDSLVYITATYYYDILDKLDGDIIKDIKSGTIKNEIIDGKKQAAVNSEVTGQDSDFSEPDEHMFLNQLYNEALSENLYYNQEDLYNLHVSIKTSPLTIISGMSGTGKTRMAELYAKTLSLKTDDQYIIIPISPSYTEPGDVLGYLNTMSGIYTPAETGLVDLLKRAEKNPNQIYMVIFDEMNLSQVEHWFSPFISLLELEDENRKLKLFNPNSVCQNDYESEIKIGKNVVFVGTVNIDETTKEFSDRLLDRANVIVPDKLTFTDIKDKLQNNNLIQNNNYNNSYQLSNFNKWRKEPKNPIDTLSRKELLILDQLHQEMNRVDTQKGVSFRIVKNIASYIENIPCDSEGNCIISREKAFDIQIKQRVLTKLKGHHQQYGSLIGEYTGEIDDDVIGSKIYNILISENAQKISTFKYSINELKRKAKEMYFNGYTA